MLAVGEEDLCIFTKVSMTDKGFHALCLKKHSEYSRVGHDAIIGIKPFAVSRSKSFNMFCLALHRDSSGRQIYSLQSAKCIFCKLCD